jgi:hypothetical protein
VRGKLALATPPIMVALFGVMRQKIAQDHEIPASLGISPATLFYMGMATCFLNLANVTVNQFAADRAGLTLELLLPLRDAQILRGKALGFAWLVGLAIVPTAGVALLVADGSSAAEWVCALLGVASVQLLIAPLAAILAASFPRSVDISKTTAAARPHAFAAVVGGLALMAAIAAPVLARVAGVAVGGSGWAGAAAVAAWVLASAGVFAGAMPLAAQILSSRRENLALVAQGR